MGCNMKGIILAGGTGSRLFPITRSVNKHLIPVYDKPMIYYPLTTLLSASISQICIICNIEDHNAYKSLLGTGEEFGADIRYIVQTSPEGIPQAFSLAADFIGDENVTMILGDNIFVDNGDIRRSVSRFRGGASIFGIQVTNPSDYGVVEVDKNLSPIGLSEKPKLPKSNFAIPGCYIFDSRCIFRSQTLKKSKRGEFEITDLLKLYLEEKNLNLSILSRGTGWIDAGTTINLGIVSRYIESMQQMHGIMVGSPHEAAFVRGFINEKQLHQSAKQIKSSNYGKYLLDLVKAPDYSLANSLSKRI